jgi:hypothetical protein
MALRSTASTGYIGSIQVEWLPQALCCFKDSLKFPSSDFVTIKGYIERRAISSFLRPMIARKKGSNQVCTATMIFSILVY